MDHHFQSVMKQRESYIRNTGQFLAKLKAAGEVPKGVILVTADVAGLCHSILSGECLDKFCNSILSFINKYQERLLERSLSLCMLVSLWTTLKRNFKDTRYKTRVLEDDIY